MCQAIMEIMNKQKYEELKDLSGDSQQIHEFLIQIMDYSGEIVEKCFGIRCMDDKDKKKQ